MRYEQVERAMREGVPIEATEPGALDALSMRHDAIRSRGEGSGDAAGAGAGAGAGASAGDAAPREKDETRAFGPGAAHGPRAVLPFAETGQNPAFAGTSGQHPAFVEATGQHPVFTEATGQHPAFVEASGQHPAFAEASGQHPVFDGASTGAHGPGGAAAPGGRAQAGQTTPPPESGAK